jgi:uncharacterized protein YjbJ (UPF0337 family)
MDDPVLVRRRTGRAARSDRPLAQDPIGTAPGLVQSVHDGIRHIPKKNMNSSTQDKAEGTAKKIAGSVKETTGKLIGNPHLEADGKAEKVEGQIQEKVGEIKKVLGS